LIWTGLVDSYKRFNAINTQLLQQAMRVVEFTVGMMTHQEKNTYTHPGHKENEGNVKLHLLDRRA